MIDNIELKSKMMRKLRMLMRTYKHENTSKRLYASLAHLQKIQNYCGTLGIFYSVRVLRPLKYSDDWIYMDIYILDYNDASLVPNLEISETFKVKDSFEKGAEMTYCIFARLYHYILTGYNIDNELALKLYDNTAFHQ
jgi:hypothetical protein